MKSVKPFVSTYFTAKNLKLTASYPAVTILLGYCFTYCDSTLTPRATVSIGHSRVPIIDSHIYTSSNSLRPPVWKNGFLVSFAAFCLVVAFGIVNHEFWADEADAWLMARDAGVGEIIQISGHSGHPIFWYLLLAPFAKLGLPPITMALLNGCASASFAYILLRHSPFPVWFSTICLFSNLYLFEYSVIARNYSVGVLLLFLIAVFFDRRHSNPYLVGFFVIVLANIHAVYTIAATSLIVFFLYEIIFLKGNRHSYILVALSAAGSCFAGYCVWPRPDGQIPGVLISRNSTSTFFVALREAFVLQEISTFFSGTIIALIFAAVACFLSKRKEYFIIVGWSYAGLLYLFCFKYYSGLRCAGALYTVMLFTAWIARIDLLNHPRRNASGRMSQIGWVGLIGIFAASAALSYPKAIRRLLEDYRKPYSGSLEMAQFIKLHGLTKFTIAANPVSYAKSPLCYLDGVKFYWPNFDRFGSFAKWDGEYARKRTEDHATALTQVKRRFTNWQASDTPVLYLTSSHLPQNIRNADGYGLLFSTAANPIQPSEQFYLYAPVEYLKLSNRTR